MHPIAYIIVALAVIAARWWSVRERRASSILLVGILCLLSVLAIFRQYVFNVGPDDLGAVRFAKTQLFVKTPHSVEVLSFEPDNAGSTTGLYRIRYDAAGLQGVIPVYYDGISRQFSTTKPTPNDQPNSYERPLLPH
jgi:hypothetical protein